jgi:4-amino-4-deoxy-L-arabinose transferase-like glycosyltransferase
MPWSEAFSPACANFANAPPLYFLLSWLALTLGAPFPEALRLVSLLAGALLPLAVHGTARALGIERRAALAAAVLTLTAELPIQTSVVAMTDALFGTLFVAAIGAAWLDAVRRRPSTLALAVATLALVSITKYHGFLAWALTAIGAGLGRLFGRPTDASLRRLLIQGALTALVCLPVAAWVLTSFGWDAFLAHRRQFVVEGWAARGQALATYGDILLDHGSLFLLALGVVGAVRGLVRRSTNGWVTATWAIGFMLALASYMPYARLALPLIPALAILSCDTIVTALPRLRPWIFATTIALMAGTGLARSVDTITLDNRAYETAVARADRETPPGVPVVFVTQDAAWPYFLATGRRVERLHLHGVDARADQLIDAAPHVVVVTDLQLGLRPGVAQRLDRAGARELWSIPNPLPDVLTRGLPPARGEIVAYEIRR